MGQAMPPIGVRGYYAERERVLQEIKDAGSEGLTQDELVARLAPGPALLPYHLVMLGDLGQIEWTGTEGSRRVRVRKAER